MSEVHALSSAMVGCTLILQRRESDWLFIGGDEVAIRVECLWRLRSESRLLLTSKDDGHQFGLPAPIDAVSEFARVAGGLAVSRVDGDGSSGDLRIAFSEGLMLELISDSSGYESWEATYSRGGLIGRGDGLIGADLPDE